ncbi:MAG: hypothetical protein GY757_18920 [bacterium]|nr:hypothetical protein [bacterium]
MAGLIIKHDDGVICFRGGFTAHKTGKYIDLCNMTAGGVDYCVFRIESSLRDNGYLEWILDEIFRAKSEGVSGVDVTQKRHEKAEQESKR